MKIQKGRAVEDASEDALVGDDQSILVPDDEPEIERETVSIHRFFKYNDAKDNLMLFVGTLGAVIAGLLVPSIALIMGSIAQSFGESGMDLGMMSDKVQQITKLVAFVALAIFFFGYLFFALWQHLAENISFKLRKIYLDALLKQEVAFFERAQIESIPAQMGEIFQTVQRSIGEQYANLLFAVCTAVGGMIFGFMSGSTYAAALVAYLPVFFIILGTFGIMVKKSTADRLDTIKQMGGAVSETLYAIKVVASFGREKKELQKFTRWSEVTRQVGRKYQRRYSFMVAIMKLAIFSFYTFAFYIGSIFIENRYIKPGSDQPYTSQDVLTVLIALITGFLSLIAALPHIQGIQAAKLAGSVIFNVIDRKPKIRDCANPLTNFDLKKQIAFTNVSFRYPTAPPEMRNIFNNVSFTIKAGESTAIVGPSGFGKSTIVQMIERFYDPTENKGKGTYGTVSFDGVNIKKIRLRDLREAIGYVPQEPTMIIGTIRENLLFGNRDATDQDIKAALHRANAQFVFDFEHQLDTFLGSSSVVNLSGGQKQRLAIARALLKNPRILILDEATSALDPQSEMEVQEAIENIESNTAGFGASDQQPLTILIIAHRLTSIKNAKNLLFIEGRDIINAYKKDTPEYEQAMHRLKNFTYAYGEGEEEEQEQEKIKSIHRNSVVMRASSVNANNQEKNGKSEMRFTTFKSAVSRASGADIVEQPEYYLSTNKKYDNASEDYPKKSALQSAVFFSALEGRASRLIETDRPSVVSTCHELALADALNMDSPPEYNVKASELMKYYRPSWLVVVGLISSAIASVQLPVFGYLLSQIVFDLMMPPGTPEYRANRDFWVSMFGVMCGGLFVFTYLQKISFGYGSENLTYSIRVQLFEAILYKHIGWFDNKARAPGVLGNIIQEDINLLNGLTSETYAVALEAALGLTISAAMCLIFSWQVGLIAIVLSPLMVFGGFFMSSFQWAQGKVDDAYAESNALLSDIIMNYRTVISLGEKNVEFMLEKYYGLLEGPNLQGIKKAHISGILYGYSQSVRFIFVALSFYFAILILENSDNPDQDRRRVFTAVYIMFVGAIGSGVAVSQMPSLSRAKAAARKIFTIIKEESEADSRDAETTICDKANQITKGYIKLQNVSFKYQSRNKYILKDFNLDIRDNESVALVGHSGSGKSTIASLLLRFYQKQKGRLLIDDKDIETYPVKHIRDQIAIVMQEPLLFNESILENIKYGCPDASNAQVIKAATQANCLDFIQSSQDQFSDPVLVEELKREFEGLLQSLIQQGHASYAQVKNYYAAGKLSTEETYLIKECLDALNTQGLKLISNNINQFQEMIQNLQEEGQLLGQTWESLILALLWRIQALPDLQKILEKNKTILEEVDQMAAVQDYLHKNPWKVDEQALHAYIDSLIQRSSRSSRGINNAVSIGGADALIHPTAIQSQTPGSMSRQSEVEDRYNIIAYLRANKEHYPRVKKQSQQKVSDVVDPVKVQQKRETLHPGFRKLCGLRGSKLSGGQKQRVAIARALIRDPRILILDEATSALDEKSQEIVQKALENAMQGRTSIVIAHRLSTVKKCDRIVVIHNGNVVEQGTYAALSENPESYFFKLKAGMQVDE